MKKKDRCENLGFDFNVLESRSLEMIFISMWVYRWKRCSIENNLYSRLHCCFDVVRRSLLEGLLAKDAYFRFLNLN